MSAEAEIIQLFATHLLPQMLVPLLFLALCLGVVVKFMKRPI